MKIFKKPRQWLWRRQCCAAAEKLLKMRRSAFLKAREKQWLHECTQKDIVDQLLQSKQSVHSSIKMLEQDGYVKLEYSEKNRKNKYVHLTEKGATLSVSTANKIVEAENRAFKALDATELETLLKLFERLSTSLNNEMGKIK